LRCFQVIIKIGSVISVDFQNLRFFIFMNMNGRPACPPAARPGKRKRGAKNDLGKAGLNAQCYSSIHSMMFYGLCPCLPLFARAAAIGKDGFETFKVQEQPHQQNPDIHPILNTC
jgi:hypothetical protein